MKFIAISDIHLGAKLFNEVALEQDMNDTFRRLIDLAIREDVDFVVICGDLFDDNKPTPDQIKFVASEIERASSGGVAVVGLAGDHDKPINQESWVKVCGIQPVDTVPQFAGCDYSDNPKDIFDYIEQLEFKSVVEWLFFHGQIPALFPFVDEKKKLDFTSEFLFEHFPKLKGVILGDIHVPLEGKVQEGDKEAYIGYCGSPGVVKTDEIGTKKGILCWDGQQLKRLPFHTERQFISIDFTGKSAETFDPSTYVEQFKANKGKKPYFRVEYDRASESQLEKLRPLYECGLVKPQRKKTIVLSEQKEESVSIRTELSTEDRVAKVLRTLCAEEDTYQLLVKLVSSKTMDLVKNDLDIFRDQVLHGNIAVGNNSSLSNGEQTSPNTASQGVG